MNKRKNIRFIIAIHLAVLMSVSGLPLDFLVSGVSKINFRNEQLVSIQRKIVDGLSIKKAHALTANYDFSLCGTTCDTDAGWWSSQDDVDQFPFGGSTANRNDHVQASDAQFDLIESSDNSRWTSDDPSTSDEILWWNEMTISEPEADITQIDFTWEGSIDAGTSSGQIYVLNAANAGSWQTNSNWTAVGSALSLSTTEASYTRSLTTNISDYIDDSTGLIIWAVYAGTGAADDRMITDFVGMTVTYNPPVVPISISGTITNTSGSAITTGPTVRAKVNGAGDYSAVADGSGNYEIELDVLEEEDVVTLYIDGATEKAVHIFKQGTGEEIDADLHQNHIILETHGAEALDNTDLALYDSSDDADIPFTVSGSNLSVTGAVRLFLQPGAGFTPGGDIAGYHLTLSDSATLDMSSSNPDITLTGNLLIESGGIFTKGSGTLTLAGGAEQTVTDNNTSKQDLGNMAIESGAQPAGADEGGGGSGDWWNSSWKARRKITIDNSSSTTNLTDFPFLVKLDETNFDFTKTEGWGGTPTVVTDDFNRGSLGADWDAELAAIIASNRFTCGDFEWCGINWVADTFTTNVYAQANVAVTGVGSSYVTLNGENSGFGVECYSGTCNFFGGLYSGEWDDIYISDVFAYSSSDVVRIEKEGNIFRMYKNGVFQDEYIAGIDTAGSFAPGLASYAEAVMDNFEGGDVEQFGFGADLRFVDADDTTELAYEIEKWDPANEVAYIWVKVPQIDAESTGDFIWLYYDNDAITYESAQTIFDDFNRTDSELLGEKWGTYGVAIYGNQLINWGLDSWAGIWPMAEFENDQSIEAKIVNTGTAIRFGIRNSEVGSYGMACISGTCYYGINISSTETWTEKGTFTYSDGEYIKLEAIGSQIKVYKGGVQQGSFTDTQVTSGYPELTLEGAGTAVADDVTVTGVAMPYLGQNPSSVWDSDFRGVWHLAGSGFDSSSKGLHGWLDTEEAEEPQLTEGKIGDALSFNDEESSYVGFPTLPVGLSYNFANGSSYTISALVKPTALTYGQGIVGTNWNYMLEVALWGSSDGMIGMNHGGGSTSADVLATGNGGGYVSTSEYRHITMVKDGVNVTFYVDGVAHAGDTTWDNNDEGGYQDLFFGRAGGWSYTQYFDGIIDEVRISTSTRSADWAVAEYRTANDQMAAYSSEEIYSSGDTEPQDIVLVGDAVTGYINSTASTVTVTMPSVTAGNALLCFSMSYGATGTDTLADDKSNTWTRIAHATPDHVQSAWLAMDVESGATDITYTRVAGNGYISLTCYPVTGLDPESPVADSTENGGQGIDPGSLTVSGDSLLLSFSGNFNGDETYVAADGWELYDTWLDTYHGRGLQVREVGAGTYSAAWGDGTSSTYSGAIAIALTPEGGGGEEEEPAAGWYNTSWLNRKPITLDNSSSSSSLTNFPVLVALSASNIDYSKTQDSGQDIRFTDSGGATLLSHEIEVWNESGTSYVWVKVPTLAASSNNTIYVYYNNSSASDGQAASAVWDSGFRSVYHLPDGSTLSANDSTSNAANGTVESATATAGKVGGSGAFAGSNQAIDMNYQWESSDANMTISQWIKSSATAYSNIVANYNAVNDTIETLIENGKYESYIRGSNNANANPVGSTTVNDNQWHHVVTVVNGTTVTLYVDGAQDATASNGSLNGSYNSGANLHIGMDARGDNDFVGSIDEVRISNVARSADWIRAEYNWSNNPNTYNLFGEEEEYVEEVSSSTLSLATNIRLSSISISASSTLSLGSGKVLTLSGDFTNNGTFTADGGTLAFEGTGPAVVGGSSVTTFHDFDSIAAGKTIRFEAGKVFNFTGDFAVSGGSGDPIYIESTIPGKQWIANFSSEQSSLTYANIKDAGCTYDSEVVNLGTGMTTGGNAAVCWFRIPLEAVRLQFGGGADVVFSGGGDQVSGGGSGGGGGSTGSDSGGLLSVSDNFNRASLGANWNIDSGTAQITSNRYACGGEDCGIAWDAFFSENSYAEAKIYGSAGNAGVGIFADNAGFRVFCSDGQCHFNGGENWNDVFSENLFSYSDGNTIRLEKRGNKYTVLKNGASQYEYTASSFDVSGTQEIELSIYAGATIDDFSAGDIAPTGGGGGGGGGATP